MRKTIDCFIYNGEEQILDLRFRELNSAVDEFWIIESPFTFTGIPKNLKFEKQASSRNWPTAKIKYFIYASTPTLGDPWTNEFNQRNLMGSFTETCAPSDLLLYSDVDEIPKSEAIQRAKSDSKIDRFGFEMSTFYLKLNYKLIEPAVIASSVCTVGFSKRDLELHTVNQLRTGIRDRTLAAEIYKTSGWHFSYMMTEEHIEEKIKAFSHQEFNKPEILNKISIKKILENKEDLLSRDGFKFDFCSLDELPKTVRENTFEYRNLLH